MKRWRVLYSITQNVVVEVDVDALTVLDAVQVSRGVLWDVFGKYHNLGWARVSEVA